MKQLLKVYEFFFIPDFRKVKYEISPERQLAWEPEDVKKK